MTKGIPRGVEFAGGTVVIVQFDQPVSVEQVRAVLDRNYPGGGGNAVVQAYGDPAQRHGHDSRAAKSAPSRARRSARRPQQVEEALKKGNLGALHAARARKSSAGTVGRELDSKGLLATVLSLVGILAYLAFRFQFSFGVGAVVATIHDLLITLAFLAFFRYDMSLNVIAAILTMTGYSTNDTIVIFDRIRENLRSMRRDSLHDVINVSVNQTLSRTIITVGHGAADRAGAVLLRRRSAARLRVHDGRRHHHRHLFEHLHRRGDRQLLARHRRRRAPPRMRPAARLPTPRSSPRAGRSRSGKYGPHKVRSEKGSPFTTSKLPRSSNADDCASGPAWGSSRGSLNSCRCRAPRT